MYNGLLADGVVEDIITALSRMRWLFGDDRAQFELHLQRPMGRRTKQWWHELECATSGC